MSMVVHPTFCLSCPSESACVIETALENRSALAKTWFNGAGAVGGSFDQGGV